MSLHIPVLEEHIRKCSDLLDRPIPIRLLGHTDDLYFAELLGKLARGTRTNVYAPGLGLSTLSGIERSASITLGGQLRIELDAVPAKTNRMLWIRDIGEQIREPEVLALLKRMAMEILKAGSAQRVIITGTQNEVPAQLVGLAARLELGRPSGSGLKTYVTQVLADINVHTQETIDEISGLLRGLDAPSILRVLREANHGDGESPPSAHSLLASDRDLIDEVRAQRDLLLRNSSVVEVVASDVTLAHVGGLKHLTRWLARPSHVSPVTGPLRLVRAEVLT
jgi:hypothetical protein